MEIPLTKNSLSREKEPDPRSPMTPGCLGPVTTLFNCTKEEK